MKEKKFKKVSHFARPKFYRRMESEWGICLCGQSSANDYDNDIVYGCHADGHIPEQDSEGIDHFICSVCGRVYSFDDDHLVGIRSKGAMQADIDALDDLDSDDYDVDYCDDEYYDE